ncbi:Ig-like domain-containing protein [Agromyces cerinus]|uniref:Fibronectin type III domain-containing protein n=1 Tax=Agromyces cerinus subsp. cerinus TaxID=232089 RepID=A0A1N6DLD4_9MICO|nr:Ig-like domain-containing protein [Agromyces cerinus]SIN71483.1 Fibronectin type III domain-containing protein [Agromyces cerinus subsp. cerinus]
MSTFASWVRTRKAAASTVAISLLAGVPLTFAVLHQGFPVTDVDLSAREVWVTNGKELLAGRLNRQIEELDAAVNTASNAFDVLQDGDDVFLYDESLGSIERIDPAFTTLGQGIAAPPGSEVDHGGETLAILSPKGELWVTGAAGDLQLNPADTEPIAQLGKGAHIAVSNDGVVYASSAADDQLVKIPSPGAGPEKSALPAIGEHQLSIVGDEPVVLDTEKNALIIGGSARKLDETALKIQQVGAESDSVLLATGEGLLRVPLAGGDVETIAADIDAPTTADEVASPVWLDGCAHGAWAGVGRYVSACDGREPAVQTIEQVTAGSRLEFRVNRSVIALNNLSNGNVWLVDSNMRLVDNWDEVTPPDESDAEEGDEKASQQTFEDTLAERSETNRPPTARDDEFGVRPGRTTLLEVLENDTDPDGDVLTATNVGEIAEESGKLEVIDGGRALQFTPAPGASGTVSFQYTADDGRLGVAQAHVDVTIRPTAENNPPVAIREGAISVEQGKAMGYNVLSDWIDPDGDDVFLVSASPTTGDSVRFAPDGFVTFEHKTGELGTKEVQFVVSDGTVTSAGVLTVEVKEPGALNPVGTPDFAEVFAGETVMIEPLVNDLSPSGEPLALLGVEGTPTSASVTPNLERGAIAFSSRQVGSHIFIYNLGAGAATSVGLIRVDVKEAPGEAPPPIAVKDTAYLRPGEPTTLPVLINDVSPSGRVLAVQTVDTEASGDLLSVEVLNNAVARITASEALTEQLQFAYTVSDGIATSTTTVTVVPVPPLVKHQPPVAVDDAVAVRAGDIVTVPVLENDYHPDAAPITLDSELADVSGAGGLAFTSEGTVRYQAPKKPGVYTVGYRISDDYEQSASAVVRFTVVAPDAEGNRAPLPLPLTSRTFEGTAVKIDIPLDGLDPDGDSVTLVGITTPPSLGRITDIGSTHISYEANAGSAGTDSFTYEVADTSGASATGTIRIGVIPRPTEALPPNAVDDVVELRPGRRAAIDVLANDSDPSGYPIKVQKKLPEVGDGLTASVKNNRVLVEAPEAEGGSSVRYEITNGHGGADGAFIQVLVAKDAKIEPPTAHDKIVEPKQVVDKSSVTVDPLKDAQNPGGLVEDLTVAVEGPNSENAEVMSDGTVKVTPTSERQAIAYRLTNEIDDLTAMAFIVVPPNVVADDDEQKEQEQVFPPPYLADLGPQIVRMNGTISWNLGDIVIVPSGKPARILSATASNSDGTSPMTDASTLTYTPAEDFRGPSSVTFEVTDGESATDPKGRKAFLTINVTVGDPNFEDVPPTFTPRTVQVEAGEAAQEIDLRESSGHPSDAVLQQLTYNGLQGQSEDFTASLNGSKLTVGSPLGVQPGTKTTLTFTVDYKEFSVPGSIDVEVVSSSRPTAQVRDDGPVEMEPATSKGIDVLANDLNPFESDGVPLRIIDAQIDQASVGSTASVSYTASDITVTTGPTFTGELSIVYRVQDGTKDPLREVTGRATVIVRAPPDRPAPPVASAGDAAATVRWQAPATNNSPIIDYTVRWSGGSKTFPADAAGSNQPIDNLTNGQGYSFTVTARNEKGSSAASPASETVTPYGTPTAPRNVSISAGGTAPATLNMNWSEPSITGGGSLQYKWRLNGGAWNYTNATSASTGGASAGTWTVEVQAINRGSGQTGPGATASTVVSNPQPSGSIGKGASMSCQSGGGGCAEVRITWSNMDPGTYKVYATINGGAVGSYKETMSIGADGRAQLQNHLGVRSAGETIAVHFENVSGGTSRTLGAISGSQWNSISFNTW